WGDWTFNPTSGTGLAPEDGNVTIEVTFILPEGANEIYTGDIRVVNTDNANDYCEIDVFVKTPRDRSLYQTFQNWIFDRFSFELPIIRKLQEIF
ncbi:MAG: hypothetical protein JSU91_07380, partial [Thermoplasmatales archaeon]